MKRGFLKNDQKPRFTSFSGSSSTHQAVWESFNQRGTTLTKAVDITELLKQKPKGATTSASAADRAIGLVSGAGQSIPRPNFEDKNKSVLIPNLIHRIPSPAATQGRERSSFCILWSSSLEKIAMTPGFPGTMPKTRLPTLFEIKSAPNMGLGLFAKHDIKVSELVLVERLLLVVPPMIPFVAAPEQHSLSEAEMRRTCREMYEENLEHLLEMMKIEDASAFRNLENRYGEDGFNSFGIVLTNGYPMKSTKFSPTMLSGTKDQKSTIEIMKGGLDFCLPFPLLLNAIAGVYIKLGNHTKAGQYKEKLARYHPALLKLV